MYVGVDDLERPIFPLQNSIESLRSQLSLEILKLELWDVSGLGGHWVAPKRVWRKHSTAELLFGKAVSIWRSRLNLPIRRVAKCVAEPRGQGANFLRGAQMLGVRDVDGCAFCLGSHV